MIALTLKGVAKRSRVQVTGIYVIDIHVIDIHEGGYAELHPAYQI
jgi:hypothetical protein